MNFLLLYQYTITIILTLLLINFIINIISFKNTANYRIPQDLIKSPPLVSILIPARNEEFNIKRCINSLLKQDYPNIEILILDDNSIDNTQLIVRKLGQKDNRVKLINGKPLEDGWLGKSYAC
jgi:chlorobactene glucosyltransferase